MRRIFLSLTLIVFFFLGCRTAEPYPEAWASPREGDGSAFAPVGRFSNTGTSNTEKDKAPTASALLFNRELEGFDIDSIVITREDESGNIIRIQPFVGDIGLDESRLMMAERKKGKPLRWVDVGEKRYVNGYDATASLMWTAGAFLPLAEWTRYGLHIAEDGALLVHLEEKAIVDLLYFFPVPFTDEIWLRYAAVKEEN